LADHKTAACTCCIKDYGLNKFRVDAMNLTLMRRESNRVTVTTFRLSVLQIKKPHFLLSSSKMIAHNSLRVLSEFEFFEARVSRKRHF
jgi:hypothetical protein